jgi:uncharacterized protein (TIGR03435 family)
MIRQIAVAALGISVSGMLAQSATPRPKFDAEAPSTPLFSAIQQQLGLRLEVTRGPVAALVIDKAERPSAN